MISFMVSAAGTVYATFLACCPVEYVVDCASWGSLEKVKIAYRYETVDGQVANGGIELGTGFKPWLMVFLLTEAYEKDGWHFKKLANPDDPTAFLIFGSPKSPIKSVSITGDTWEPIVERRFRPPTK